MSVDSEGGEVGVRLVESWGRALFVKRHWLIGDLYDSGAVVRRDLIFIIFFFFFNDTATTWIYTLSLHDALPIFGSVEQPSNL